jgi:hypothetical protein
VVAHSLGQDEAYFAVREILGEASTTADGVLKCEPSDFNRCRSAMLELSSPLKKIVASRHEDNGEKVAVTIW